MLEWLTSWGYIGLFIALALEGTVGLGLVVPGVTILLAAGFLAGTEGGNPAALALVAMGGVWLGDNISYSVGRWGLSRWQALAKFRAHSAEVLESRGSRGLLFLYHFPVVTRTAVPLALGSVEYPLRRWLAVSAIASLLFSGTLTSIGYLVGHSAGTLGQAEGFVRIIQILGLIGVLVLGGWIATRVHRSRRSKAVDKDGKNSE